MLLDPSRGSKQTTKFPCFSRSTSTTSSVSSETETFKKYQQYSDKDGDVVLIYGTIQIIRDNFWLIFGPHLTPCGIWRRKKGANSTKMSNLNSQNTTKCTKIYYAK